MEKSAKRKTFLFAAFFIVFFMGFYVISRWAPVAGDDWVYASAGRWNNPFVLTYRMYHIWSGRILSEFWGFTVAVHKELWNVLNAFLFTAILFLLLRLGQGEMSRWTLTDFFLTIALMLSVPNHLRMQTYTWMMGTTYVMPLFLFLLLVYSMSFFQKSSAIKWIPWICILEFCIPLYMENAAALVALAQFLWLLQAWRMRKKTWRIHFLFLAFALAGCALILFSPGAHMRMANDHAAFLSLSMGQKLAQNWPHFLARTFTDNVVLTLILLLLFAAASWHAFSSQKRVRIGIAVFFALAVILQNGWLDLLAVTTGTACIAQKEHHFEIPFVVICALGANLVMLASPIFDSRSAIYTVYLWILTILLLYRRIPVSKRLDHAVLAAAISLTCIYAGRYFEIYHMVHQISLKRDAEIAYYKTHPEEKEAWFIRYPDELVHSPDVLDEDVRHADAFRWYYGLADDLELHFYSLQSYDADSIWGKHS